MQMDKINTKVDGDFNVIIEIPMNDKPVKYEFDKKSGAIFVDRFIQTAMYYPCNYGFIPHTLSNDGDPIDVLVISNCPVVPGAVMRSRPIGVLMMADESGIDEKIIAVPTSKLDISFDSMKDIDDVSDIFKKCIVHFFEHYKDLEKGKWVKVTGFDNAEKAKNLIDEAILRYNKNN
jgi:inorganic pyrophosphatase